MIYELRDEKDLSRTIPSLKIPKDMLSLASHILDTKAGHFDPSQFKDEFELELRKLVKGKAAGETIEAPKEQQRPSNVVDLMEALRQSVKNDKRVATKSSPGRKMSKPKARRVSSQTRGGVSAFTLTHNKCGSHIRSTAGVMHVFSNELARRVRDSAQSPMRN